MNNFHFRTDLAEEVASKASITKMNFNIKGVSVNKVVVDEEEEREVGKKKGVYYSIDTRAISTHDSDDMKCCEDALYKVLKEVLLCENIDEKVKGLIVGLGNINVTPDSLGPNVIDRVIITRHLFLTNPDDVSEGLSEICALSPGVMGTTGIETFDIIQSIIKKVKVDYIIAVDALASRAIDRVNKTIQVTNTGISPGSGVGNKRKELSFETVGVPVIAIGVPTVVDAVTITADIIGIVQKSINEKVKGLDEKIFGKIGMLSDDEKKSLIDEALSPTGLNMIVTPKEVDIDIEELSIVISNAINRAVHPIIKS